MRLSLVLPLAGVAAFLGCTDRSSSAAPSSILDVVAFETRQLLPAGVDRVAATAAVDLTGDGLVDLAALGIDGRLVVNVAQTAGVLAAGSELQLAADAIALRAADLDGDGDVDLVAASRAGTVQVLENDGLGTFVESSSVAAGPDLVDVLTAVMVRS